MITKDQIAEAMRNSDAISEEHNDMARYWREHGVDPDGMRYCALQHGLRQVLLLKGMDPNVRTPTPIALTPAEAKIQVLFAGAFMCGYGASDYIHSHGPLDA